MRGACSYNLPRVGCVHLPKEREDSYAEKTSRYQDVFDALGCLMDDANFQGNPTLLQEVKSCLLGL